MGRAISIVVMRWVSSPCDRLFSSHDVTRRAISNLVRNFPAFRVGEQRVPLIRLKRISTRSSLRAQLSWPRTAAPLRWGLGVGCPFNVLHDES